MSAFLCVTVGALVLLACAATLTVGPHVSAHITELLVFSVLKALERYAITFTITADRNRNGMPAYKKVVSSRSVTPLVVQCSHHSISFTVDWTFPNQLLPG